MNGLPDPLDLEPLDIEGPDALLDEELSGPLPFDTLPPTVLQREQKAAELMGGEVVVPKLVTDEELSSIAAKEGKVGFWESIRDKFATDPTSMIPFFRAVPAGKRVYDLATAYERTKRANEGTYAYLTPQDEERDLQYLTKMVNRSRIASARGKSIPGMVADILLGMVPYALEFSVARRSGLSSKTGFAASSAFGFSREAAMKAAEQVAIKQALGSKVSHRLIVRAMNQAVLPEMKAAGASAISRMAYTAGAAIPVTVWGSPGGMADALESQMLQAVKTSPDTGLLEALGPVNYSRAATKGVASSYVDALFESTGYLVDEPIKKMLQRKLPTLISDAWLKAHPSKSIVLGLRALRTVFNTDVLAKLSRNTGMDGVAGEVFEEWLGKIATSALDLDREESRSPEGLELPIMTRVLKSILGPASDPKEYAAMALAFSVLPIGNSVFSKAMGRASPVQTEENNRRFGKMLEPALFILPSDMDEAVTAASDTIVNDRDQTWMSYFIRNVMNREGAHYAKGSASDTLSGMLGYTSQDEYHKFAEEYKAKFAEDPAKAREELSKKFSSKMDKLFVSSEEERDAFSQLSQKGMIAPAFEGMERGEAFDAKKVFKPEIAGRATVELAPTIGGKYSHEGLEEYLVRASSVVGPKLIPSLRKVLMKHGLFKAPVDEELHPTSEFTTGFQYVELDDKKGVEKLAKDAFTLSQEVDENKYPKQAKQFVSLLEEFKKLMGPTAKVKVALAPFMAYKDKDKLQTANVLSVSEGDTTHFLMSPLMLRFHGAHEIIEQLLNKNKETADRAIVHTLGHMLETVTGSQAETPDPAKAESVRFFERMLAWLNNPKLRPDVKWREARHFMADVLSFWSEGKSVDPKASFWAGGARRKELAALVDMYGELLPSELDARMIALLTNISSKEFVTLLLNATGRPVDVDFTRSGADRHIIEEYKEKGLEHYPDSWSRNLGKLRFKFGTMPPRVERRSGVRRPSVGEEGGARHIRGREADPNAIHGYISDLVAKRETHFRESDFSFDVYLPAFLVRSEEIITEPDLKKRVDEALEISKNFGEGFWSWRNAEGDKTREGLVKSIMHSLRKSAYPTLSVDRLELDMQFIDEWLAEAAARSEDASTHAVWGQYSLPDVKGFALALRFRKLGASGRAKVSKAVSRRLGYLVSEEEVDDLLRPLDELDFRDVLPEDEGLDLLDEYPELNPEEDAEAAEDRDAQELRDSELAEKDLVDAKNALEDEDASASEDEEKPRAKIPDVLSWTKKTWDTDSQNAHPRFLAAFTFTTFNPSPDEIKWAKAFLAASVKDRSDMLLAQQDIPEGYRKLVLILTNHLLSEKPYFLFDMAKILVSNVRLKAQRAAALFQESTQGSSFVKDPKSIEYVPSKHLYFRKGPSNERTLLANVTSLTKVGTSQEAGGEMFTIWGRISHAFAKVVFSGNATDERTTASRVLDLLNISEEQTEQNVKDFRSARSKLEQAYRNFTGQDLPAQDDAAFRTFVRSAISYVFFDKAGALSDAVKEEAGEGASLFSEQILATESMAGTADLIAKRADGSFVIFDLKTWFRGDDKFDKDTTSSRSALLQLLLYKDMLLKGLTQLPDTHPLRIGKWTDIDVSLLLAKYVTEGHAVVADLDVRKSPVSLTRNPPDWVKEVDTAPLLQEAKEEAARISADDKLVVGVVSDTAPEDKAREPGFVFDSSSMGGSLDLQVVNAGVEPSSKYEGFKAYEEPLIESSEEVIVVGRDEKIPSPKGSGKGRLFVQSFDGSLPVDVVRKIKEASKAGMKVVFSGSIMNSALAKLVLSEAIPAEATLLSPDKRQVVKSLRDVLRYNVERKADRLIRDAYTTETDLEIDIGSLQEELANVAGAEANAHYQRRAESLVMEAIDPALDVSYLSSFQFVLMNPVLQRELEPVKGDPIAVAVKVFSHLVGYSGEDYPHDDPVFRARLARAVENDAKKMLLLGGFASYRLNSVRLNYLVLKAEDVLDRNTNKTVVRLSFVQGKSFNRKALVKRVSERTVRFRESPEAFQEFLDELEKKGRGAEAVIKLGVPEGIVDSCIYKGQGRLFPARSVLEQLRAVWMADATNAKLVASYKETKDVAIRRTMLARWEGILFSKTPVVKGILSGKSSLINWMFSTYDPRAHVRDEDKADARAIMEPGSTFTDPTGKSHPVVENMSKAHKLLLEYDIPYALLVAGEKYRSGKPTITMEQEDLRLDDLKGASYSDFRHSRGQGSWFFPIQYGAKDRLQAVRLPNLRFHSQTFSTYFGPTSSGPAALIKDAMAKRKGGKTEEQFVRHALLLVRAFAKSFGGRTLDAPFVAGGKANETAEQQLNGLLDLINRKVDSSGIVELDEASWEAHQAFYTIYFAARFHLGNWTALIGKDTFNEPYVIKRAEQFSTPMFWFSAKKDEFRTDLVMSEDVVMEWPDALLRPGGSLETTDGASVRIDVDQESYDRVLRRWLGIMYQDTKKPLGALKTLLPGAPDQRGDFQMRKHAEFSLTELANQQGGYFRAMYEFFKRVPANMRPDTISFPSAAKGHSKQHTFKLPIEKKDGAWVVHTLTDAELTKMTENFSKIPASEWGFILDPRHSTKGKMSEIPSQDLLHLGPEALGIFHEMLSDSITQLYTANPKSAIDVVRQVAGLDAHWGDLVRLMTYPAGGEKEWSKVELKDNLIKYLQYYQENSSLPVEKVYSFLLDVLNSAFKGLALGHVNRTKNVVVPHADILPVIVDGNTVFSPPDGLVPESSVVDLQGSDIVQSPSEGEGKRVRFADCGGDLFGLRPQKFYASSKTTAEGKYRSAARRIVESLSLDQKGQGMVGYYLDLVDVSAVFKSPDEFRSLQRRLLDNPEDVSVQMIWKYIYLQDVLLRDSGYIIRGSLVRSTRIPKSGPSLTIFGRWVGNFNGSPKNGHAQIWHAAEHEFNAGLDRDIDSQSVWFLKSTHKNGIRIGGNDATSFSNRLLLLLASQAQNDLRCYHWSNTGVNAKRKEYLALANFYALPKRAYFSAETVFTQRALALFGFNCLGVVAASTRNIKGLETMFNGEWGSETPGSFLTANKETTFHFRHPVPVEYKNDRVVEGTSVTLTLGKPTDTTDSPAMWAVLNDLLNAAVDNAKNQTLLRMGVATKEAMSRMVYYLYFNPALHGPSVTIQDVLSYLYKITAVLNSETVFQASVSKGSKAAGRSLTWGFDREETVRNKDIRKYLPIKTVELKESSLPVAREWAESPFGTETDKLRTTNLSIGNMLEALHSQQHTVLDYVLLSLMTEDTEAIRKMLPLVDANTIYNSNLTKALRSTLKSQWVLRFSRGLLQSPAVYAAVSRVIRSTLFDETTRKGRVQRRIAIGVEKALYSEFYRRVLQDVRGSSANGGEARMLALGEKLSARYPNMLTPETEALLNMISISPDGKGIQLSEIYSPSVFDLTTEMTKAIGEAFINLSMEDKLDLAEYAILRWGVTGGKSLEDQSNYFFLISGQLSLLFAPSVRKVSEEWRGKTERSDLSERLFSILAKAADEELGREGASGLYDTTSKFYASAKEANITAPAALQSDETYLMQEVLKGAPKLWEPPNVIGSHQAFSDLLFSQMSSFRPLRDQIEDMNIERHEERRKWLRGWYTVSTRLAGWNKAIPLKYQNSKAAKLLYTWISDALEVSLTKEHIDPRTKKKVVEAVEWDKIPKEVVLAKARSWIGDQTKRIGKNGKQIMIPVPGGKAGEETGAWDLPKLYTLSEVLSLAKKTIGVSITEDQMYNWTVAHYETFKKLREEHNKRVGDYLDPWVDAQVKQWKSYVMHDVDTEKTEKMSGKKITRSQRSAKFASGSRQREDTARKMSRKYSSIRQAMEHGVFMKTTSAPALIQRWAETSSEELLRRQLLSSLVMMRDASGLPLVLLVPRADARGGEHSGAEPHLISNRAAAFMLHSTVEYLRRSGQKRQDTGLAPVVRSGISVWQQMHMLLDVDQFGVSLERTFNLERIIPQDSQGRLNTSLDYILVRRGAAAQLIKQMFGQGLADLPGPIGRVSRWIIYFNRLTKELALSISFFHMFAESESYIGTFGLKKIILGHWLWHPEYGLLGLRSMYKDMKEHPEKYEEWQGFLMDAAPRYIDVEGRPLMQILDSMENLANQTGATKYTIGKGIQALKGMKNSLDWMLWEFVVPTFRMQSALMIFNELRNDPRYAEYTDKQLINDISQRIADDFGGQDWDRMLWATPKVRDFMRIFFFAPDWTVSCLRQAGIPEILESAFGVKVLNARIQTQFGNEFFTRYWPAYFFAVMLIWPNLLQWLLTVLDRFFDHEEEKDMTEEQRAALKSVRKRLYPPLALLNSSEHMLHVNVTPLYNWIGGDQPRGYTQGRLIYAIPGKQLVENFRLFQDPIYYLAAKSSTGIKMSVEQLFGRNVSGWKMGWVPEAGENPAEFGGLFEGAGSGEGDFWQGRLGTLTRYFVPSVFQGQLVKNAQDKKPSLPVLPMKLGMSVTEARRQLVNIVEAYARKGYWDGITGKSVTKRGLEVVSQDVADTLSLNLYDSEKLFKQVFASVAVIKRAKLAEALEKKDTVKAKELAEELQNLKREPDDTFKAIEKRMKNKRFGRGLSPEERTYLQELLSKRKESPGS